METSSNQIKDKKQQEPGKPPAVKKSTVIGKMKGQIMGKGKRTPSTTSSGSNNNSAAMSSLLQTSGSFDLAMTRSSSWGNKEHCNHNHYYPADEANTSFRSRANTAPSNLEPDMIFANEKDKNENTTALMMETTVSLADINKDSVVDVEKSKDQTTTATTKDDLVISTSGLSDAARPSSQGGDVDDDDDEEIRLAKAMAQAIQANPNMTPEEIHKLIGKSGATTAANQLFNPSRITSLFTTGSLLPTTVTAEAPAASITTASNSNGTTAGGGGSGSGDREIKLSSSSSSDGGKSGNSKSKRSFRFDGSRLERATRGLLTGSSSSSRTLTTTTTAATTAVVSSNSNSNASQAAAAVMSSYLFAEQENTTNAGDGMNDHHLSEVSSVVSAASGGGGGGGLRLSFRQPKATPRSPSVSPNMMTTTTTSTKARSVNTTTTAAATTTTTMPSSGDSNNSNSNGNVKHILTTANVAASTATKPKTSNTTTTTTSRSLDENQVAQQPVVAKEPSTSLDLPILVPTVMDTLQQSIQRTTVSVQTSVTAATAPRISAPTTSTMPSEKTMADKRTTGVSFAATKPISPTNAVSSGPIRLSGLAWKRRGGMGKYSSSGAWERRRIELQGSRLLYYQEEAPLGSSSSPTDLAAAGLEEIDEGLLVQKRTTWLEQVITESYSKSSVQSFYAAAALAAGATTVISTSSSADDPTAPRGYMELTKDKATVQASWGHSGAPSPFAISIKKPGGETKWKFCFDYHKDQMEWLAALTDVVVSNSVDSYNQLLLEAADPSNQYTITDATPAATAAAAAAAAILHPHHSVASPPGTLKTAHQLWTMGSYCIGYPSNMDLVEAAKLMVATTTTNEYDGECDETESPSEGDEAATGTTTEIGIVTTTKSISVEQGSENIVVDEDIVDEELDAIAQAAAAADAAVKTRVLPEQNMARAFGVLNVALAFCRSSSTSMEGFWYVVALANVSMFLLTIQQPDWKSLVQYVRAVRCQAESSSSPLVASSTSVVATSISTSVRNPSLRKNDKFTEPVALQALGSMQGKTKARPRYLPLAGTTAIKLENTTDKPANSKGEMFAGWRCPPGDTLQVRSHGYSLTKNKVDSPGELYECVRVDVFESPARYPDMAKRVQLPKVEFKDDGPKTWRTPDIIVISIALPTDPPKMGRSSSDGGGYTITMYCTMTQETRDILRRVTADGYDHSIDNFDNGGDPQKSKVNAVRLLEEWCRRAPTDPSWFSRFKVVPNAHNLKEIGMPSWISKYNGKPFLIKRPGVTGFLHQHPELSCLEFDISIHPFPYLAKQAICFMKESYFKRVLVTFGFVIEGKTDDELPECIIAAMQLCYPDPAYAIAADTFFAGTCHSSFD